jgi:hypothetical protein
MPTFLKELGSDTGAGSTTDIVNRFVELQLNKNRNESSIMLIFLI